jgi:hypothetical protein
MDLIQHKEKIYQKSCGLNLKIVKLGFKEEQIIQPV